ncbi:MAG: hypothetical protein MUQ99_07685, partial [Pseudomonadales bacterium]|nr:hypothetical protein [Pseudomonadales bacterium]
MIEIVLTARLGPHRFLLKLFIQALYPSSLNDAQYPCYGFTCTVLRLSLRMSLRNQPAAFFTSTFYPALFVRRLFIQRLFYPAPFLYDAFLIRMPFKT